MSSDEFFDALATRISVSCPGCGDPPLGSVAIVIDRCNLLDEGSKICFPKVQCIECGFIGVVPESWLTTRLI